MDYLSDMALFVEVAQANGFSRAAAKLGIPQSTLSRRIAAWKTRSVCACSTAARGSWNSRARAHITLGLSAMGLRRYFW